MEDWNRKLEETPNLIEYSIDEEEEIAKEYIKINLSNLILKKLKKDKKIKFGKTKKYIEDMIEYINTFKNI